MAEEAAGEALGGCWAAEEEGGEEAAAPAVADKGIGESQISHLALEAALLKVHTGHAR